jgi:hypothetical protein
MSETLPVVGAVVRALVEHVDRADDGAVSSDVAQSRGVIVQRDRQPQDSRPSRGVPPLSMHLPDFNNRK